MLSYCCSASVLHCCDRLIHTIRCDTCHSSLITTTSMMACTRAQNQAAPKSPPKSSTSCKRAMSAASDKSGKKMKKQQKKEEASKEGSIWYTTHPFPRFRQLTRSPPHPIHLPCIKTPAAHYLELPLPMADPVRTHQRLPTGCPPLCNNHHLSQHR